MKVFCRKSIQGSIMVESKRFLLGVIWRKRALRKRLRRLYRRKEGIFEVKAGNLPPFLGVFRQNTGGITLAALLLVVFTPLFNRMASMQRGGIRTQ
jgi:hypothetical protein